MLIGSPQSGQEGARVFLRIAASIVAGLLVGCAALNLWARAELRGLTATQVRDSDMSHAPSLARQVTQEEAPSSAAALGVSSVSAQDFLKHAQLLSQRNAAMVKSSSSSSVNASPSRMGGEEVQLSIAGSYTALRSVLLELHGSHAGAYLTAVAIRAAAGSADLEMVMNWWLPALGTGAAR